ncbi:heme-copper oxidase subunit III [Synechococcus sp. HJ21-Hayes]|jgi:cytochrome c oxidase subunit 3|uniref:cytochrome c oxidase subunit 3 n=1 Tax=unclassified Synechococcus TaxID=2626047 RepID=UPI0020CCEDA9|nr:MULTISPECIES: heme-copper oxidase subunit III [unclassified Synechococcus]MCP9830137.1 heme-copper oxidase subunit III [Synechococcus sp. JJ3a-Johnson]MCP9853858.1 heme-copper oxidase subunit III [Synechococcus sp. HJ21-Hayes]
MTSAIPTPAPAHGHSEHPKHNLTGFIIFLCSESVIFLAFFSGYAILKTSALNWLPAGVDGLEWRTPLLNTVVLLSSSGAIVVAEHFKAKEKLWLFRGFWLLTMAMGAYFLYGQAVEWSGLKFGFTSGTFGGTFYLLTGFHGLHVATGILLMGIMLIKSFIPGNYDGGEQGVQATSLFWHFVDVIWVVLFLLLYVWQA